MTLQLAVDNTPSLTPIDAEQSLLGAIMLKGDVYASVASLVRPEHFFEQLHGRLFEIMGELSKAGRSINPITIKPFLPEGQMVGDSPVHKYLGALVANSMPSSSVESFAGLIREMALRRQLVAMCEDVREYAHNTTMPVHEGTKEIVANLARIDAESRGGERQTDFGLTLGNALDTLSRNLDTGTAMDWCLPEITDAVGKMRPGNLVGLMSDSGGGKSSISLQQAAYSSEQGHPTAFFSIEITDEEAALQIASQRLSISMDRLDRLELSKTEEQQLHETLEWANKLPLHIVPFSSAGVEDIRAECLRLKQRYGITQVLIDHAKMIDLPGRPGDLFAERINGLYRGLKSIAKELEIAVVILIQRNDSWRNRVKANQSPRPINGDAYGGGSVKQSLDSWFSIYRPEPLYEEILATTQGSKRDEINAKLEASRGKAWIINHKRRRGLPMKTEAVRFVGEFTRFESLRKADDQDEMFDV